MDERLSLHVAMTRMGWAGVALSQAGIRYATLFHRTRDSAEGELRAFGAEPGAHADGERALLLLQAYAEGEPAPIETFPVDLPECSPLQRKVWLALREIPRGETRSNGGWRDTSARGRRRGRWALRWEPTRCRSGYRAHRVVAADGSLHGFGGGLAMKQELLELEGHSRAGCWDRAGRARQWRRLVPIPESEHWFAIAVRAAR